MDQDVRRISDSVFVTGDYVFLMDYPDEKMRVIRIEESTIEEYKTTVDQKCAAECRLKECLQRILNGSWGEPKSTEELMFANDLARWSYKYELCRLSLGILDLNNKLVSRLQGNNIDDNPLPTSEQIVEDLSKTLSEYNKILNDSSQHDVAVISNALRSVCTNEIMKAIRNVRVLYTKKKLSAKDIEERDNNLRYIQMYRTTLTDFYTKDTDILTAFKEMVDSYIAFKRNAIAEKLVTCVE